MDFPAQLQTSPYLTLLKPGQSPPVVYMSDTLGPEYPDTTAPSGAVFGAVGLDRKVSWVNDNAALQALTQAAAHPIDTPRLTRLFGAEVIADLARRDWLQHPDDLCREYYLRTGQIEITAHCNWGCSYCPVASDPKPAETMPMDLFTHILDELNAYQSVRFVTFHFFNEPTLDRHFEQRVIALAERDMKLSLSTNGSALTPAKIQRLRDTGVLHHLVINLPTVDEPAFRELTGSKTYHQSLRNLDHVIDAGLPVTLAVNGTGERLKRDLDIVTERYEPRGVEVRAPLTCDRAGALENEYSQDVHVSGPLTGCSWPVNHAYFSVRGDMFICCNDYYQREVFGNIRDGSLHEVMTSDAAIRLRRKVFGVDDAPDDYLCRACHDQLRDFPHRQFRPVRSFPLTAGA